MTTLAPTLHASAASRTSDGIYAELCILNRRSRALLDTLPAPDAISDLASTASALERAQKALSAACDLVPLPPPEPGQPTRLLVGDLSVCIKTRTANAGNVALLLTRSEFDLLVALAIDPQAIISKVDLLNVVWGYRTPVRTRTVDTHTSRLRRKLQAALPGEWCVTRRGLGYSLTHPSQGEVAA